MFSTDWKRSATDFSKETNYVAAEEPSWLSVDNLRNVELDAWPWTHLDRTTLDKAVSALCSNAYDAAKNGYLGFVQYYAERRGASLCQHNENGETSLHLAIKGGHLHVVKYIASRLPAHNLDSESCINNLFTTPLGCAAYYNHLDIVKYLIDECGVDWSCSETEKMAAEGGNLSVIKYLVEEKGFPVQKDDVLLLLSAASGGNVELIKYLIYDGGLTQSGKDPFDGDTVLHKAALKNKLEAVEFFVEDLALPIDVTNWLEDTPAHSAAQGGSLSVLRYLIDEKGANIAAESKWGSILHTAAQHGHLAVVKYLVEEKGMCVELTDSMGRTPIHRAALEDRVDVVKYFADEKKVSLNVRDNQGKNLLHQVTSSADVELMKYLVDDKKMMGQLEEVTTDLHHTVVMEAAYYGHLEILKFLVDEKNADITIRNNRGNNALHIVAVSNKLPIVKYLVEEKGFEVNAKNFAGKTAHDLAVEHPIMDVANVVTDYLRKMKDVDAQ